MSPLDQTPAANDAAEIVVAASSENSERTSPSSGASLFDSAPEIPHSVESFERIFKLRSYKGPPRTECDDETWDTLRSAVRFLAAHVSPDPYDQLPIYIAEDLQGLKGSRPVEQLLLVLVETTDNDMVCDWWAEHKDETPVADFTELLHRAYGYRWPPTEDPRPMEFDRAPIVLPPRAFQQLPPGLPPHVFQQGPAELPPLDVTPPGLPPLTLQQLPKDWLTATPPPRRWIVEGYLPAETATLLISLGGLGKSYLVLYLAICVALGHDFCGERCEQGPVVVVSGEDDYPEIWRRLFGLAQYLALPLQPGAVDQLRKNIDIVDVKRWRRAQGVSPVLTKSDRGGAVLTPLVSHLARSIGKANLVLVDTVSRFNGAEENSNDAAARLIDAFEIIAEETGAAVLALAHTGIKGRTEDVNQYSSRGASAFSDNARSVLVLAPLAAELAGKITDPAQYAKAARNDLLRLCHTKSNYARRSDDVYFERQAQGVLVPTQLNLHKPESEDQLVERLLAQVGAGEVTRNTVRNKFAEWFGPMVTRQQAFSAFDTAVREGRLVLNGERNNAKCYRVKPSAAANGDLVGLGGVCHERLL